MVSKNKKNDTITVTAFGGPHDGKTIKVSKHTTEIHAAVPVAMKPAAIEDNPIPEWENPKTVSYPIQKAKLDGKIGYFVVNPQWWGN